MIRKMHKINKYRVQKNRKGKETVGGIWKISRWHRIEGSKRSREKGRLSHRSNKEKIKRSTKNRE